MRYEHPSGVGRWGIQFNGRDEACSSEYLGVLRR